MEIINESLNIFVDTERAHTHTRTHFQLWHEPLYKMLTITDVMNIGKLEVMCDKFNVVNLRKTATL